MKHYITVTGTKYRHGTKFAEPGMKLVLTKEPENEYDKEAIRVEAEGIGKIGYVANSVHTVIGDSISAGRLYDRIGRTAHAKVRYVLEDALICKVCKKDIRFYPDDMYDIKDISDDEEIAF